MDLFRKLADLVREPDVAMDGTVFCLLLGVSLVLSLGLSLLYRIFYEDRATGSQIHRSFVLIGPAITALFVAIQFSLPLSLGLLGALSIIRFRTPIKEPEEVGFIMLLCACAVVIATMQFVLLFALLVAVIIGLLLRRLRFLRQGSRQDGIVLVTYSVSREGEAFRSIRDLCEKALTRCRLESLATNEGVKTAQFSFLGLSADAMETLSSGLSDIETVVSTDFYFNRGATLH